MSDEAEVEITNDAELTVQAIASEEDPVKRQALLDAHKAKHEILIGSGILTRKQSKKIIDPLKDEIDELTLRKKIDAAPGTAEQKLEWLSKQDENKLGVTKKALSNITSDIKTQWMIQKHNESEAKKAFEDQQKLNGYNFMVRYHTGQLKPEELGPAISSGQIDASVGTTILNNFGRDAKETEREQEKTNKEEQEKASLKNYITFSKAIDDVSRGARTKEDVLNKITEARDKGYLVQTHAKQLAEDLIKIDKEGTPIKRPEYLNNCEVLDKMRELTNAKIKEDYKGDDLIGKTYESDTLWSNKKTMFTKWMEANPQATTQQVNDYFKGLMATERKKITVSWIDRFFGAGSEKTSEAAVSKPAQTQPIKELKVNTVYTDAQGNRAKFLGKDKQGKDQWQAVK
jgi:hypothetical protein